MIRFESLFSALNKAKVRYLVVGGIAVNLYGIERATADIDLVVDLEENNLNRFIAVMKEKVGRPQDIADVFYLKKIEKGWSDE